MLQSMQEHTLEYILVNTNGRTLLEVVALLSLTCHCGTLIGIKIKVSVILGLINLEVHPRFSCCLNIFKVGINQQLSSIMITDLAVVLMLMKIGIHLKGGE